VLEVLVYYLVLGTEEVGVELNRHFKEIQHFSAPEVTSVSEFLDEAP